MQTHHVKLGDRIVAEEPLGEGPEYMMESTVTVAQLLQWFNEKQTNRSFSVAWDGNYGIDRRSGWSVTIDGIVVVELEPSLLGAAMKTISYLSDD